MRRFASWAISVSWRSGGSPDSPCSSNVFVASSEATSPARAPPIPSATANIGGATNRLSSFVSRWRPTSLAPVYSTIRRATRLLLVAVLGVADADHVRLLEALAVGELPPVQVGAVGGAHVLDVHEFSPRVDASVVRGRVLVLDLDIGAVGATQGGAVREVEECAGIEAHGRHHLEARACGGMVRSGLRAAPPQQGLGAPVPHGLRSLAPGQVALRAPCHPEQEQVQHGEEAELERDGERLVHLVALSRARTSARSHPA